MPFDEDEPDELGDPENILYFPEPMTRYSALRAISAATVGERDVTSGDTALGFFATPTSFSSSAPLGTAGDWTFHAQIDGAFIQRTFAALSANTAVGTLTLMGTRRLDEDTGIGLGVNLGLARSSSNIPVTVNSAQFGVDAAIVQVLGPNLTASGVATYKFGVHSGTIGGVAGSYTSHTVSLAGRLQGNYDVG